MPYYFGYGSNMNYSFFKKRCPGARFIEAANLGNAKFVYDGIGKNWDYKPVANVISSNVDSVWGAVYEINESDLSTLDQIEWFPVSYGKGIVEVVGESGEIYKTWIYFRIGRKSGEPSDKYRKKVLDGANESNIPKDYIEKYIL